MTSAESLVLDLMDTEVNLFYSVISKRIDIGTAGFYGYRNRIDASRAYLKKLGIERSPWLSQRASEILPGFTISNVFEPMNEGDPARRSRDRHLARSPRGCR